MGILNRLKQAFGLSTAEFRQHPLRSAIGSSHASRELNGHGSFDSQSVDRSKYDIDQLANAAIGDPAEHLASSIQTRQTNQRNTPGPHGDLETRTSQATSTFTSSQDETMVIEVKSTDTSVDMPTQDNDAQNEQQVAADLSTEELEDAEQVESDPVDLYDEFGLDIGDDMADVDGWDDEENLEELSEDGVCQRCWIEDREESFTELDQVSGLMICPRCKCSYRTVEPQSDSVPEAGAE